MNTTLLGVILSIIILFLFTLIKKDSKYSKYGINLRRIYCPKCNIKQPFFRKPENERQQLYGGKTCENCGTEMDKYGTEIK
jgi:hypothetical protein